jgi:ABC-type transporter lipoprotein component MlaA
MTAGPQGSFRGALIFLTAVFIASCSSQQPAPYPLDRPIEDAAKAAKTSATSASGEPSPWDEAQTTPAPSTSATETAHQARSSTKESTDVSAAGRQPMPDAQPQAPGNASSEATASDPPPDDPLSPLNEKILAFNVFFDDHVGRPVGTAWGRVVPYPARLHIRTFFRNTGEPKNLVNCMLQRRFRDAGITLERFSLNSTLGVAGFFDVAQDWFGLERKATDFGLTAARHSVKYGPYLMAPVGGPTSVRDAAGTAVDGHLNPLGLMVYLLPSLAYMPISVGLGLIDAINERSLNLETFEDVNRYTVDLYGAVQDGYYQKRIHEQAAPGIAE